MNEKIETTFGGTRDEMTMLAHVFEHYIKAKEKHPYFCDALLPHTLPRSCFNYLSIKDERQIVKEELQWMRGNNADDARKGETIWKNILDEEVWEAIEAMANGDTAAAIEELYHCVAVCLRTIDVLEGRQALGKPKEV